MKKITAILLILIVLVGLCACSGGSEPSSSGGATEASSAKSGEQLPSGAQTAGQSADNGQTTESGPSDDPSGDPAVPSGTDPTESVSTTSPAVPTEPTAPTEPTLPVVVGSEGLNIKVYSDSCEVRGIGTFSGTELIIPSHVDGIPVTSIDEDALTNDTMVSLFIPWTVRSIGEDAVSDCLKLETVAFSEGLLGIGFGSFAGCSALKTVTLPSTLETIGNSAFRNCTALTEVTLLGNTDVNNTSFSSCPALTKVTFAGESGRAYSLKNGVFQNDAALCEIVFSEGLQTIGAFCMAGCTSLSTVVLPKSLTKVEASAFQNVGSLTVYYAGSEEDWAKIAFANGNDALTGATIVFNTTGPAPVKASEGLRFMLNDDGASYKVDGKGTCTDEDLVIPDSYEGKPVTVIGYRSLENMNIKSVTIPDTVTAIEDIAFQYCFYLQTINWGKGLKTIGNSAFAQCSALTGVVLPEGLETLGGNSFFGCSALKTVVFPTTLTSLSYNFSGCSSLQTITVKNDAAVYLNSWGSTIKCAFIVSGDVTKIGNKYFDWCDVTAVTIESDVTELGDKAFNYCKDMKTITLPATLQTVGADVFYGCNSLTTVNYRGSEEDWAKIGWNETTDVLKNATIVFNYQ